MIGINLLRLKMYVGFSHVTIDTNRDVHKGQELMYGVRDSAAAPSIMHPAKLLVVEALGISCGT